MKSAVSELLAQAVQSLQAEGFIPADVEPRIMLENTRDKAHGDLATNLAMTLAKPCRQAPRQIAERLVAALPDSPLVRDVEIAGPGFINFFLSEETSRLLLERLFAEGQQFGRQNIGQGEKIQVEFVSANPTGPLHVGHGRGAAYGATVSDLLAAVGFEVHREYYVNDAGRQMDILATSVYLRYLELCGESPSFPDNGYRGDYIIDIARAILAADGEQFRLPAAELFADVRPDASAGGDKEQHIDDLIAAARRQLGTERYERFFGEALEGIRSDIEQDLHEFGIDYQLWFSERSLTEGESQVEQAIRKLQDRGHVYEKDGALWFRSTDFGDDKDRVLKRDNGQTTYFASDVAYHENKFARGFSKVINIWGADHHGYIARVRAAMQALGYDPDNLIIPMVQFANLYRGSEKLAMSTRSGSFVTLRELRAEVGNDAARFIYVTRKVDQQMDFDLELAKSQSKDNPVYYVQYAHARVASVLRKLEEDGQPLDRANGLDNIELLTEDAEKDILKQLAQYPEVLRNAALSYEPHQMANYLRDLAGAFHAWYNGTRVLVREDELRNARLTLALAVQQVIANGLHLLGVSAPDSM
ncbi:arginine--tRNA ligase [Natronospirillum operosum]|uniref:Arginine--tRNA ligase n=1 Tax=Natronospirillum operosum TaxID=2759953 RepID=A0A4Z0WBH4_9GAMM|nr:arginine--tRNA ligase [Natronospirillum operosum]TGG93273.1 arginine--tRNA ligase [Natronospirillum operosum]